MGVEESTSGVHFLLVLGVKPLQDDVGVANEVDRGHPVPLAERGSRQRTQSRSRRTAPLVPAGAPRRPQVDQANPAGAALPPGKTRCESARQLRSPGRSVLTIRLAWSRGPSSSSPRSEPST